MSEDVAERRGDERPQWLDVALTVLPPLSLITALLVYFASVRRLEFAAALGLNADLLEEPSILGYLLRSTQAVFLPLLVGSIGLLLWLSFDRMLRRWVVSRVHLQAVSRISRALPISAALLGYGQLRQSGGTRPGTGHHQTTAALHPTGSALQRARPAARLCGSGEAGVARRRARRIPVPVSGLTVGLRRRRSLFSDRSELAATRWLTDHPVLRWSQNRVSARHPVMGWVHRVILQRCGNRRGS